MGFLDYKSLKNIVLTKELFHAKRRKDKRHIISLRLYTTEKKMLHFINNADYQFHADYISEILLSTPSSVTRSNIDKFNLANYKSLDRRFFIGIISFEQHESGSFFTLETVEIDTMSVDMICLFHTKLRQFIELKYQLLFKPSSHKQELLINGLSLRQLPRILNRDLVSKKKFTSLNSGSTKGRLRCFSTKEEFKDARKSLEWFDIILMPRVPDSIPRISGIINSHHTTPLSHTNVLAHSWSIPNAIQIGAFEKYNHLNNSWVSYEVDENNQAISLMATTKPENSHMKPAWKKHFIKLEEPDHDYTPIKSLADLRLTDRYIYGTKAANLVNSTIFAAKARRKCWASINSQRTEAQLLTLPGEVFQR